MSNKKIQNTIRSDSSVIKKMSSTVIDELNQKYCTGCSACMQACPKTAISMITDREGFLKPQIDNTKCVACGVCVRKCPQLNPERVNYTLPVGFAVMADDETRMKSSSGGMFTIAASWIVEQGGTVCGAAFDDLFNVRHILVRSMDELSALRGSKYIQSDTQDLYIQIKKELDSGKPVLFTGVPCQVATLYAVVGRDYNNLYTIDLMCHGVSSYKVLQKYLHDVHHDKPVKDLYFKRKEPWGWGAGTCIFFEDGTKYEQYHYFDPFFVAYHSGVSRNSACSFCESNQIPRQGNLTMGDFWGIDILDPEMNDYKGTSAVLINNDKGQMLFDNLRDRIFKYKEQPISYILAKNAALKEQNPLSQYRNTFFGYLDNVDFGLLVYGCRYNCFFDLLAAEREKTVSREDMELFNLAKYAADKCGDRKIITWVNSAKFEKILLSYFGKQAAFGITTKPESLKKNSVILFDEIVGKSNEYFLVLLQRQNDPATQRKLLEAGYTEGKDYISKTHMPIVIENYDLSEGPYFDNYGNSIEGSKGTIGKVTFIGSNNHIILENGVTAPENLSLVLGSNGRIEIDSGCRFNAPFEIRMYGSVGYSALHIYEKCTFGTGRMILESDRSVTSVTINRQCAFGDDLLIEAGQGNRIVIGRECMISRGVSFDSSKRLNVYDVSSGNECAEGNPDRKDIIIGEHTSVSTGCIIRRGTVIGSGSMISNHTRTDSRFLNNCLISGEPASVIRKDIFWSKNAGTEKECPLKYRRRTELSVPSSLGCRVLVIGNDDPAGYVLVEELLKAGYKVTLCNDMDAGDHFGTSVRHLKIDPSAKEKLPAALTKETFDYVYDTVMLDDKMTEIIVRSVKCKRYIMLSSAFVYSVDSPVPVEEVCFDPLRAKSAYPMNSAQEFFRNREIAAFRSASDRGIEILSVRVPRVVSEREVYLTAIKALQRAEEPGSLYSIKTPVVFVRSLGEFLVSLSNSSLTGAVNYSDKGIISEDELQKTLIDISDGHVDFDDVQIQCSGSFSPLILDTAKAESAGFSIKKTEEWLLPMLRYYSQRSVPYEVKYRIPRLR